MLPQDTTHLIQRSYFQRGSMCQDPAANRTTRRPSDHRKEMQTEMVWTCLPFIRSGQNHLARHSKRRQGRQKKRWEDNIREWTWPEFAKSQRAVENWEKWRNLVVKSSALPLWPPRLSNKERGRLLRYKHSVRISISMNFRTSKILNIGHIWTPFLDKFVFDQVQALYVY